MLLSSARDKFIIVLQSTFAHAGVLFVFYAEESSQVFFDHYCNLNDTMLECVYRRWQTANLSEVKGIIVMRNTTVKKRSPFKKLVSSITAALTAAVMLTGAVPDVNAASVDLGHTLSAQAHVQNIGWMEEDISLPLDIDLRTGKTTGDQYRNVRVGTTGRSLRLESLTVGIGGISKKYGGIMVDAHVSHIGWQGYKTAPCGSSVTVGTTGRCLAIEAFRIKLYGKIAEFYDVEYSVHSAGIGWGHTRKNGQVAGTVGEGRRSEAIYIRMIPKK